MDFCLYTHLESCSDSESDKEGLVKKHFLKCLSRYGVILDWQLVSTQAIPKPISGLVNQLCLQVKCQVEVEVQSYSTLISKSYAGIYNEWIKGSDGFPTGYQPWLTLIDPNKAFNRCSTNAHKQQGLLVMKLGALYYPSAFLGHDVSCEVASLRRTLTIDLFYDSRRMVINFSQSLGFNKMEIPFSSILRIFVKGNSMILNIMNHPLLYSGNARVERPHTYYDADTQELLGRSNAILLEFKNDIEPILSRLHFFGRKIGFQIHFVAFSVNQKNVLDPGYYDPGLLLKDVLPIQLEFSISYLIEALIRRSLIIQVQGFNNFLTTVKMLKLKHHGILERSLSDLVTFSDAGLVQNFAVCLEIIFLHHKNKHETELKNLPENTQLVRQMVVTPSRILLWPPEINRENRILRKFDSDFSLRVVFRDDDLVKFVQRFIKIVRGSKEKRLIKNLVEKVFSSGIILAGRHYEMLAWSNSQLRDHGAWMYARDNEGSDATSIRSWMGDFSNIKSVPKYMARMGQCFSHTSDILNFDLQAEHVDVVPDITGGYDIESRKPYVFSDGIGQISQRLITKLCSAMELPKECSAFQMRFSGMKGMLSLNPKLTRKDIVFRESQNKFECPNSRKLEVCKIAKSTPLALNRPLITILEQLGISAEVFLGMQKKTLLEYTEMFFNEDKAAAYLTSHSFLSDVPFQDMNECGIQFTNEPFFRGMILAGHRLDLNFMKTKARIPIDPSEGRNMFGVLDETGILKYGQVFVRYTTNIIGQESNTEYTILEGTIMVLKNPCYQAGDVRKFQAVNIPDLHHHRDCIVFPQKGIRPHPNELSGSDLDGDEYSVIWKKDLIFSNANEPARSFPVVQGRVKSGPIQLTDMIEFFVDFVSWDNIGSLSINHLIAADSETSGVFSKKCISLARQCSIAVDAAKSGEFAKMDKELKPSRTPDFLEKFSKPNNYRSESALGKLYRSCRSVCDMNISYGNAYEGFEMDPLLVYPGWQEYSYDAGRLRDSYESYLSDLFSTYGITNESEAMSGCFSKFHCRFSLKNGRNEIEDLVRLLLRTLWKRMKQEFLSGLFDEETKLFNLENVYRKASAWYVVTYNRKTPMLLSFAWIPARHLANLKLDRLSKLNQVPPVEPVFDHFTCVIQKQLRNLRSLEPETLIILQLSGLNKPSLRFAAQLLLTWCFHNKRNPNTFDIPQNILIKLFLKLVPQMNTDDASQRAQKFRGTITKNSKTVEASDLRQAVSLLFRFFSIVMDIQLTGKSLVVPQEYLKRISLCAVHTYQRIAISHDLKDLGLATKNDFTEETEEDTFNLPLGTLSYLDDVTATLLKSWTQVDQIFLRTDENEGEFLTAIGSQNSLLKLQELLGNGTEWLKNAVLQKRIIPSPAP